MAWDGKTLGRAGAVIAKTDKGLLCLFCAANYSRTSTQQGSFSYTVKTWD